MALNPFLTNGHVSPVASINKAKIVSLGSITVDEHVKNKVSLELVSSNILNTYIDKFLSDNNICIQDNKFDQFLDVLENTDIFLKECAIKILRTIGRNLGWVLLALKRGDKENRLYRPDWKDQHWEFWRNMEHIQLCGGLTTQKGGDYIVLYANELFDEVGFVPYKLSIIKHGEILPLIGACSISTKYGDNTVVLDVGHSFIKRCLFKNEQNTYNIFFMDKYDAKYVSLKYNDIKSEMEDAVNLNNYLLEVTKKTYISLLSKEPVLSSTIVISIANYVYDGIFAASGGYSKLRLLCENYQRYFSYQLSNLLDKKISVLFVHDGTSAAYTVSNNNGKNVVMTLGTGIGVGFPVNESPFSSTIKINNITFKESEYNS